MYATGQAEQKNSKMTRFRHETRRRQITRE
jgi:hypothetical protein